MSIKIESQVSRNLEGSVIEIWHQVRPGIGNEYKN